MGTDRNGQPLRPATTPRDLDIIAWIPTWRERQLFDCRAALRQLGHPEGNAPEPVWCARHIRAIIELALSTLDIGADIAPTVTPHDIGRYLDTFANYSRCTGGSQVRRKNDGRQTRNVVRLAAAAPPQPILRHGLSASMASLLVARNGPSMTSTANPTRTRGNPTLQVDRHRGPAGNADMHRRTLGVSTASPMNSLTRRDFHHQDNPDRTAPRFATRRNRDRPRRSRLADPHSNRGRCVEDDRCMATRHAADRHRDGALAQGLRPQNGARTVQEQRARAGLQRLGVERAILDQGDIVWGTPGREYAGAISFRSLLDAARWSPNATTPCGRPRSASAISETSFTRSSTRCAAERPIRACPRSTYHRRAARCRSSRSTRTFRTAPGGSRRRRDPRRTS